MSNLRANDRFNVDFGTSFDFAIAQSVFTHVSLNHMRLCLFRLAKVMKPGGVFYASFAQQPNGTPPDHMFKRIEAGRTYFNEKNVFWYDLEDMKWAGQNGPWKFDFVGEYGSSDQQLMVSYTRMTEAAATRKQSRQDAARWVRDDAAPLARKTADDVRDSARAGRQTSKRYYKRAKRKARRVVRTLRNR